MTKKLFQSQWEKEKTGLLSFVPKIKPEDLIYLLILAFLPTQFGKHFWPDFSYISGIRVDYLSPTFYFTDALILTLLILVFIKSFKIEILNRVKKHRLIFVHLFFLCFFLLANIFFSENIYAGFYGFIKLLEIIFFGLITYAKIKNIKPDLLIFVLSSSVIFEALISIFQYIKQGSLNGVFYFFGERSFNGQTPGVANMSLGGDLVLRSYGTFSHPNVLAGFLLIYLIFILFNFNLKKFYSFIFPMALVLGTISLFLTFSRVAILLWIITLVVYVFSRIRIRISQKIPIVLLILASIFVSVIFYSPFYLRFIQSSFFEDSVNVRLSLITESFGKIMQNPIMGIGVNNYFTNSKFIKNILLLQPVHNIFILIAVQTGITGLIYVIWSFYRTYKRIEKKKTIFLKLIFFYIIIIGSFDHYFLTLQQGQLLISFIFGYFWSKNE